MRRWHWGLGAASILAALGACSSFTASDAPSTDAGASEETAAPLPEPSAPDATAADGAPPNLVANPGFEIPGCDRWHTGGKGYATAQSVFLPHTDARACLVCGNSTGAFDLYQRFDVPLTPGEVYVGSAFLRAPDGGKVAQSMECAFIVYDDAGAQDRHASAAQGMTASGWLQTECAVTVPDGGKQLEFSIASMKDGAGCFLVDDAFVYRAP